MNSHINQTMIEGLLSVGLGRKPEVYWEPISNGVEPVLKALSDRRIALPQLQGGETENHLLSRTGLGLLATNVAVIPDFDSAWPENDGIQRLATAAMELGAVGAKLVTNYFFTERYIQSFVEELEMRMLVSRAEQLPESNVEVSPLELVFFASMHHALMQSPSADGELSRTVIDVLNGLRTDETSQLLMCLDDGLLQCRNSEDYANLARRLFREDRSGEHGEGSQKQVQSGNGEAPDGSRSNKAPPNQVGNDQPPQGGQAQGQPSGSDQGQGGGDSTDAQAPGEATSGGVSGGRSGSGQPQEGAQASDAPSGSDQGQTGGDSTGAPQAAGESSAADMSGDQAGHASSNIANQDGADKAASDAQAANPSETAESTVRSPNGEPATEGRPVTEADKLSVISGSADKGLQSQERAQEIVQSLDEPWAAQQEGLALIPSDAQTVDATSWCLRGGDSLSERRDGVLEMRTVSDGRLVSTLLRIFQDKKPKCNGYVAAGPRVAANRMWRLKRLGDVAVFRKTQPRSGIDISVQILLDTSGSMSRILQCASDVTIALAEAMARTSGAKCSLAVFPAAGAYSQTILPFGGQVSTARKTMQTIRAFGGTPLGGAMADVIPYLERQRTMRKLLLVITDGSPRDSSEVFKQLNRAQELDIEVIGIGIGEQLEGQLKNFIPRSAVVKTVRDLAPALEQVFRNGCV